MSYFRLLFEYPPFTFYLLNLLVKFLFILLERPLSLQRGITSLLSRQLIRNSFLSPFKVQKLSIQSSSLRLPMSFAS